MNPPPSTNIMANSSIVESRRLEKLAVRARTLAFIYFVILFVATHIPLPPSDVVSMSDKWVHFGAYLTLTLSVLVGWELSIGVLQAKHYFAVWLVGTLYGVVDELTQIPVNRTCDVNDWAADAFGVVGGLVLFGLLRPAIYWMLGRGKLAT